MSRRDYVQDKGKVLWIQLPGRLNNFVIFFVWNNLEAIKSFLSEFCKQDDDGKKHFIYAQQLVNIAHREQVLLTIDLDHLSEFNESLAEAVMANCRRYTTMFSDIIAEMLPSYKEREVQAKDALDVYIEHRLLMETRTRNPMEQHDQRNHFPSELMKRL